MNQKYLYKRRSWSNINAGVFHRIKKPKPKLKPTMELSKSLDKKENIKESSNVKGISEIDTSTQMITDGTQAHSLSNMQLIQKNILHPTIPQGSNAPKIPNVTDDATDLKVDKPEFENIMKENKIDNILKILEDDWANDEYDTMDTLINDNTKITLSPLKSNILPNNVGTTSPNELSELTSAMNIMDTSIVDNTKNPLFSSTLTVDSNITKVEKENKEKYYPLFNKGYCMSNAENKNIKSMQGVKKGMKWQVSSKGGGGGKNQYQLDAGQKHFGATQCTECGIVYQLGDPEDENAHLNYHNSIRTLRFQGWKNERIIMEDPLTSSRIILIEPSDSKQCWKKVTEILNVVDRDLGLADSNYSDKQVYLYIKDKNVLGVLVAEHIETAFRMIPELIDLNCCTSEKTPAKCGINVVWTTMSHRKQGIATKLVDTLRANFFYGYIMSLDDIAFSTPTPSGKLFAEKYTKSKNFKVYN
ncbi:PREDICTED: N-acetyltransferase ESCO2 isoform X1 [Polistes canadensis]|uniref:N-acetyltransferase ESCO2 isoform X1 n=2 Tax=Polistes canadensis TaxID=91411 RepID=UPI00071901CD|nr:PREDICTED: N-acetyltransferase ESCO2 isoform X1 [Polistes canadensis]